ncbi:MAG: hypothetical protein ACTTH0_05820 [Eubacteriales bacterium]
MEKLKNFIYNTSDILIAIFIILISIAIISIKTTNILDYSHYVSQTEATDSQNRNFGLAVPVGEQDKIKDNEQKRENQIDKPKTEKKPEVYAVYINAGESIQSIADKFVGLGMFESQEEFIKLSEEMQATTSIKYGNFQIPANATKKEIISMLIVSP